MRGWGRPWLALALVLGMHVIDEVASGFLDLWNPLVLEVRERIPWSPLPTFTFGVWLGGLVVGIVILLLLTPLAARDSRPLRPLAWFLGGLMVLNGLGHVAASLWLGRPAPGVLSSPILVAASVWLLVALRRGGGEPDEGSRIRVDGSSDGHRPQENRTCACR